MKVYDKQMEDYKKEIYGLNLGLYFSQPQQQTQKQPKSLQQQPHQPHQPQQHQPQFSSLADYFKSQKS